MTLRQTLASLPRDARDTLFLLFVIVWVIAPQVANLPLWTSLLAGGVLLWRGWLAWKGRPLPGRWTVAALLAQSELLAAAVADGSVDVVGANYRLAEGRVERRFAVGDAD